MYTFSFIVGNIIPKSVKCIHSATKHSILQVSYPKGPSTPHWRTLRPFEVPKTINEDYLDP